MNDTIFALATAPGRAAVAVIRVSGPGARDALTGLTRRVPAARRAALRVLRDASGEVMDRALILWFPGPSSYTGEDCAELHLHGGVAVVDAVTRALERGGARLAEPGEFTRRAFENGKLDLDRAEAIGDLVDAQTAAQARQALAQMEGALGRRYKAWRSALIEALALLEAAVDFPDEGVPAQVEERARGPLTQLAVELDAAAADTERGQRIRNGYRIAVIGATNAGKSSLFNALLDREAAIVSEIAGATRDVIETHLTLAGYQVVLADMAGLRAAGDPIEAEGVRRARAWAEGADLRLWIVDRAAGDGAWREAASLARPGDFCLLNKADLPSGADCAEASLAAVAAGLEVLTLSLTAAGPEALTKRLTEKVISELSGSEFPAATRARHERLLFEARGHLARALQALSQPELAAEDVRLVGRALSQITGRVGAEEVLDRVFASFCIGK